ncbi:MAG: amidase [Hyphomonadaceae bacterium]|nr:amidase [Hyphomonadaceae bacterium]
MTMATTRRGLMAGAASMAGAGCASAPVSAPSDAMGDRDAIALAAAVRSGEVTPSAVIEAAIARAERANAQLNFIATPTYREARLNTVARGPFACVPTMIKDLLPTVGVRTMFGSRAFAQFIPGEQSELAGAFNSSGLVSIGKSTTPEFGFTATTEPLITGPTRNPWNPAFSAGGSSGGAGVAVAAGVVPVAHASDGGGSIRIPAAINGLVGLKPSRFRLIRAGAENEPLSISVNGCVSRTVRDTAVWLATFQRPSADAVYPELPVVTGPGERRLRIGLALNAQTGVAPDAEVGDAITAAAETCRRLGHQVRDFALPIDGAAFAAAFTTYWASGAAQVKADIARRAGDTPLEQLLEPLSLGLAAQFEAAPPGALEQALAVLRDAETRYDAAFADIDVLLTPVLAKTTVPIGALAPTQPMDVFQRIGDYVAYTPLQNAAGAPAISLPLGMSRSGLPIGAHFSARIGDERTLLELAFELERATPWIDRKPQVWVGA